MTCHETLDAGYQCVCHLDNGRIVPINGTNCVDDNECDHLNGGCTHECTNTYGSYECSCRTGYSLQPNRHDCEGTTSVLLEINPNPLSLLSELKQS